MTRVDFLATNRKPALFRRDASFIYRCENLVRALEASGHRAGMQHMIGYDPTGADAVVLHRPLDSMRLRLLVRAARRAGARIIIDVDDLIFDPSHAWCSPAVLNRLLPPRKIERRFRRHGQAIGLADAVTVSTDRLAEHVRRLHPDLPVTVIPNSVHLTWRSPDRPRRPPFDPRLLIYCPGTRSHDKDFEQIAPALERFLDAHGEVHLRITGHLEHRLRARVGQVTHSPRVPFAEYAARVRQGWVNLSPLQPTPFNECKSAIKVIEAGYWDIPTICSPNPDAQRFRGVGAIVAADENEWFQALERMLDDSEYERATRDLRARILERADVFAHSRVLLDLVERLRG